MKDQISVWIDNLLQVSLTKDPDIKDDGQLWTPGILDIFRLCHESVIAVQNTKSHFLILYVVHGCLDVMHTVQEKQREIIKKDNQISIETYMVFINNNVICYDGCVEFVDEIQQVIHDLYEKNIDTTNNSNNKNKKLSIDINFDNEQNNSSNDIKDEVSQGFLDVAKFVGQQLARSIFRDDAVIKLLSQLYNTPKWYDGTIVKTWIATLDDYLGDFKNHLEPRMFRFVVEQTMLQTIKQYRRFFIQNVQEASPKLKSRIIEDQHELLELFSTYLKKEKVTSQLNQINCLAQFLGAQNIQEFMMCYSEIVTFSNDFEPKIMERFVNFREDLEKSLKIQIIGRCEELYNLRFDALKNGATQECSSPVTDKKGRKTTFAVLQSLSQFKILQKSVTNYV
eukprot:TRINITY_DN15793_c0_g1_i1.p1 TRINITY_DN15793_c0_g1~~TRINITY_DN15793_c0_g1_i1.p1  ORF type:complete len:459 (-),score=51.15 TRINITY_DN15793_c0_g1_i1:210-1394(-)